MGGHARPVLQASRINPETADRLPANQGFAALRLVRRGMAQTSSRLPKIADSRLPASQHHRLSVTIFE